MLNPLSPDAARRIRDFIGTPGVPEQMTRSRYLVLLVLDAFACCMAPNLTNCLYPSVASLRTRMAGKQR